MQAFWLAHPYVQTLAHSALTGIVVGAGADLKNFISTPDPDSLKTFNYKKLAWHVVQGAVIGIVGGLGFSTVGL